MMRQVNFDELPCGLIFTGSDGKITAANQPMLDWLGYDIDALVGKRRFNDLLSIGGKIFFETHHATLLDLQGEVRELNYEIVDAHGKRHPVMVNARRRTDEKDGYAYVIVPFSERMKYEDELRQARAKAEAADRAKATFLSTMSHEIRTPLHAILEAGRFLAAEAPRSDQLELIDVLSTAGGNLLTIVNDILDISKMESGMMTLDNSPFRPLNLLRQLELTYGKLCQQKGVRLNVHYPSIDTPTLLGDAGKLVQVLNNLVSNAVKFTSEGEINVRIRARPDGDHYYLDFDISDTGIGISSDRQESIFEPFTQADERVENTYGGTGLGLAICKRIVTAYGSKLTVASRPGEGTSFHFGLHLPVATGLDAVATDPDSFRSELLPSLGHIKVLNVDDNTANLLINARYFINWQLEFEQVSSGKEALEKIENEHFDLVLLDLRMPDMDGYELARRIRTHSESRISNTPLVALTASASRAVSERMREAGIDDIIQKPFRPAHLHALIASYGDQYRSDATLYQDFDPTEVQKLFEGDKEGLTDFLAIVLNDLEAFTSRIGEVVRNEDHKVMDDEVHRMITTLNLFGLGQLLNDFNQSIELMKRSEHSAAAIIVDTTAGKLVPLVEYLRKETDLTSSAQPQTVENYRAPS